VGVFFVKFFDHLHHWTMFLAVGCFQTIQSAFQTLKTIIMFLDNFADVAQAFSKCIEFG
jgi:hypothetical protein